MKTIAAESLRTRRSPLGLLAGGALAQFSRSQALNTATAAAAASPFATPQAVHEGEVGTSSYRLFFQHGDTGARMSPWHDIPTSAGGGLHHFVSEIPKYGTAKMEVSLSAAHNPIVQDLTAATEGDTGGVPSLRHYHGPIYWNYGCMPQTWEDPTVVHPQLQYRGDNDPLDVVEIGSAALPCGAVTPVKVLGVLAMIDGGELDWKVIAVAASDPLADSLHDIADVEAQLPGTVSGIREWFRWYKVPSGKPLNAFGFDEQCMGRTEALQVVSETHQHYLALRRGDRPFEGPVSLLALGDV